MNNEIKGRVVDVPKPQTGFGQRGPWGRQTVVIEYENGRYTNKLALENSNRYEEFGKLRVGQMATFHYDVSSREYNGKYYTTVNCFDWKIEGAPAAAPASAPAAPAQSEGDDPF